MPVAYDTAKNLGGTTVVAIIGVGYVGQHLVDIFSSSFDVIGYDVSAARVETLRFENVQPERIVFSNEERDLEAASHFLISVPTTLKHSGEVDLSHVRSAVKVVERYAKKGSIVMIESTVAIGTTRMLLQRMARSRGIYAGMSPERIDPGRVTPPVRLIPKVVSGLEDIVPGSLAAISQLYGTVFETVVPVSKPEVAEMTKLYENCQRTITIAYANEMADACYEFGVDPFEVAQTAASKPFGYLPVYPSLGIGGHCIPVNPVYFMSTCSLPILDKAYERMVTRPSRIASQLLAALFNQPHRVYDAANKPRLLVAGLGFKTGQSDLSNSPGLQLLRYIQYSGKVDVMFCDPLVHQSTVPDVPKMDDSLWTFANLKTFDAIVVAVKQPGLDYDVLGCLEGVRVELWQRN
ncbi:hypothetical protein ACEQ8H_005642 [Pleosporales sp. CAS-2024a]